MEEGSSGGLAVPQPADPPLPSPALLPPLASLPVPTYPPSSYPPPPAFSDASLVHPALVIPARRTGELQRTLADLVYREPKRKRVYGVEAGIDYAADDVANGGYDPATERKLVLARLGPPPGHHPYPPQQHPPQTSKNPGRPPSASKRGEDDSEVSNDLAFADWRVQSLLSDAALSSASLDSRRAPPGRTSVRKSRISLPVSAYELMTVDAVLRRLLPTSENGLDTGPTVNEVPSSFEIAGHIAHVNLREEALPYKFLIGRAVLEKNRPRIRVVVNKTGDIVNEYRTFPMEVLAGEGFDGEAVERMCRGEDAAGETSGDGGGGKGGGDAAKPPTIEVGPQHAKIMEVEVREHGCRFALDFARVYFNSRLSGEHSRLVREIIQGASSASDNSSGEGNKKRPCVVADVMAGVGPFAVPLTSTTAGHVGPTTADVVCHANDLNPISYEYLVRNSKLNKCFSDRLLTYNLDGRAFIHKMSDERVDADHFIMNLPASAPEFLDAFRGYDFVDPGRAPRVHVHCFGEKARDPDDSARIESGLRARCEAALGAEGCLGDDAAGFSSRVVRDVGPRKNMFCCSFVLPRIVGGMGRVDLADGGEKRGMEEGADGPAAKKRG